MCPMTMVPLSSLAVSSGLAERREPRAESTPRQSSSVSLYALCVVCLYISVSACRAAVEEREELAHEVLVGGDGGDVESAGDGVGA